jgi:hypothetical protein
LPHTFFANFASSKKVGYVKSFIQPPFTILLYTLGSVDPVSKTPPYQIANINGHLKRHVGYLDLMGLKRKKNPHSDV